MLISVISFNCYAANYYAANYSGKLETIHSPDTRPCLFFRIIGVPEATPSIENDPWFAVSKEHIGYDEINTLLFSAYMAEKEIIVHTSSELQCGHAEVSRVQFNY